MAININREVEDAFYRYKMPKLQAKVEGKGNGIKTVIVNVSDIAHSLSRKPIYVTKYFGCELGAQVNVDEKNDRYIVNGAHDAAKLQLLLDGFIKKFVLCASCGNPETVLSVVRKGDVKAKCKACGASGFLDGTHRLTQYIIKNPPDDNEKAKAKSKKEKTAVAENSDEDKQERNQSTVIANDDEDVDWCEDTTDEAQRRRMEELSSLAKSLAMSSDVEKSKKERAHIYMKYLTDLYKAGKLLSEVSAITREADRLDLDHKSVLVFAEVVLADPTTVVENVKTYAPCFCALIEEANNTAKAQMNMLNTIVTLVDLHPELLKKSPVILHTMYEMDIVPEEIILEWAEKKPRKDDRYQTVVDVLSKCEFFFKWLREAEEETDSEEEDGSEEEEASPSPEVTRHPEPPVLPKSNATNGKETANGVMNDDDDDIDIDAI